MGTNSVGALQFLDKILMTEIECLSQEEVDFLLENRDVCVQKLLPILALEITQVKESEDWSLERLYGSLKLLALFEEKRAFDWIIQLHECPDCLSGEDGCFIILFWTDILADTIPPSEWYKLKETIEDSERDPEIREACMDVLLILVGKGELERHVVVEYFQELYLEALEGETYDPELLLILLEGSLSLWPGESMEEIREIFGCGLVDGYFADLSEIIEAFHDGKLKCLEHLKGWTTTTSVRDSLLEDEEECDEEDEEFSEFDSEESDFEEEFEDSELEEGSHFIEPLLPSLEIEALSQKEQKKYRSFPNLLVEDPERVMEISSEMIYNHPHIPALFYYCHKALNALGAHVLAMETVREWIKRFPDDLLAKIEYAHYFLRRKEPEKVRDLFLNTWSLKELYPKKSSFSELENVRFTYLLGCYFTEIGDDQRAEQQIRLLEGVDLGMFM